MKSISLKLDEKLLSDTEIILSLVKKNRDKYINDALEFYNNLQSRKLLERQLSNESKLVGEESMKVLGEFEQFVDG